MKNLVVAVRFFIWMTFLTGFLYPLTMTAFAQVFFSTKANGSLVKMADGTLIGSSWIAQGFKSPKYFWPRPSGIDYNPMPSGATNFGPTSSELANKVKERVGQGLTHELLFASGSGLDPHISPQGALDQVSRVAAARNLPEDLVRDKVKRFTEGRQFGILGEPRVNVLLVNLALDER
jgi:potassium-transporting ATPase KdpC subunit